MYRLNITKLLKIRFELENLRSDHRGSEPLLRLFEIHREKKKSLYVWKIISFSQEMFILWRPFQYWEEENCDEGDGMGAAHIHIHMQECLSHK